MSKPLILLAIQTEAAKLFPAFNSGDPLQAQGYQVYKLAAEKWAFLNPGITNLDVDADYIPLYIKIVGVDSNDHYWYKNGEVYKVHIEQTRRYYTSGKYAVCITPDDNTATYAVAREHGLAATEEEYKNYLENLNKAEPISAIDLIKQLGQEALREIQEEKEKKEQEYQEKVNQVMSDFQSSFPDITQLLLDAGFDIEAKPEDWDSTARLRLHYKERYLWITRNKNEAGIWHAGNEYLRIKPGEQEDYSPFWILICKHFHLLE